MTVVAFNKPIARRVESQGSSPMAVLEAGCHWLSSEVDGEALLSHRGLFYHGFTFAPGVRPLDAGELTTSVITVWPEAFATAQQLSQADVKAVEAGIPSFGLTVTKSWGSQSDPGEAEVVWDWFSYGIEGTSSSLVAAVDRYRGGCPSHCSAVSCAHPSSGCSWFSSGFELLKLPAWPQGD